MNIKIKILFDNNIEIEIPNDKLVQISFVAATKKSYEIIEFNYDFIEVSLIKGLTMIIFEDELEQLNALEKLFKQRKMKELIFVKDNVENSFFINKLDNLKIKKYSKEKFLVVSNEINLTKEEIEKLSFINTTKYHVWKNEIC